MNRIDKLSEELKKYNEAYQKGASLIEDAMYDKLVDELRKIDPTNEFFSKSVPSVSLERMEKLPIPMKSLEKVHSIKGVKKWVNEVWKCKQSALIVITPKYDGISLCVDLENEKAWTRGDGEEGQESSNWFYQMNVNRNPLFRDKKGKFLFGEAIIPEKVFKEIKGEYKNARNLVAGIFNSKTPPESVKYVDFVPYGTNLEELNKEDQLKFIEQYSDYSYPVWTMMALAFEKGTDEELEVFFSDLYKKFGEKYKIDGLVFELNNSDSRKNLGRVPNGNPKYAFAYKNPSWTESCETIVTDIEINVSRNGELCPVAVYEPVEIGGVTAKRATLFNMRYVFDNNIAKGSKIRITRSGDVIPIHLETLSYDAEEVSLLMNKLKSCPVCGSSTYYNKNYVDLCCTNPLCEGKVFDRLVYFCKTMEFEEMREPTLRKLYNAGFTSVGSFSLIEEEEKIKGIGEVTLQFIKKNIKQARKVGVPLSRYMYAMNFFEGSLGEKTCQMIFDSLHKMDPELLDELLNSGTTLDYSGWMDLLCLIRGVSEKTAKAFLRGITLHRITKSFVKISYVQSPEKRIDAKVIVFTGFRDKDLETQLKNKGHIIGSSVTKITNILVAKNPEENSSKIVKAKSLGIEIMSLEKFLKSEILL